MKYGRWNVCKACGDIPHIENCDTCFGYGLKAGPEGDLCPVSAHEALRVLQNATEVMDCPQCGSNLGGVPYARDICGVTAFEDMLDLVDPDRAPEIVADAMEAGLEILCRRLVSLGEADLVEMWSRVQMKSKGETSDGR